MTEWLARKGDAAAFHVASGVASRLRSPRFHGECAEFASPQLTKKRKSAPSAPGANSLAPYAAAGVHKRESTSPLAELHHVAPERCSAATTRTDGRAAATPGGRALLRLHGHAHGDRWVAIALRDMALGHHDLLYARIRRVAVVRVRARIPGPVERLRVCRASSRVWVSGKGAEDLVRLPYPLGELRFDLAALERRSAVEMRVEPGCRVAVEAAHRGRGRSATAPAGSAHLEGQARTLPSTEVAAVELADFVGVGRDEEVVELLVVELDRCRLGQRRSR